jgi:hypothetical protein
MSRSALRGSILNTQYLPCLHGSRGRVTSSRRMLGENSISLTMMLVITAITTAVVLAVVITGFNYFRKLSRQDREKRDSLRK